MQQPGTRCRPSSAHLGNLLTRSWAGVWSPPYFGSRYCMVEWQTMAKREQLVGLAGRPGLIYPIRYSDGMHFPEEALRIEHDEAFKKWNLPCKQFEASADYPDYLRAVDALAERLATRLTDVPPWSPEWEVEWPEAEPPPTLGVPRL